VALVVVVVERVVGSYVNDGDQDGDVDMVCLESLLDWLPVLIEDKLDLVDSWDWLEREFEYM
jgi:hypothetical protein